ncbi:MAG: hypothetical protein JJU33_03840 [Phycisphaerales bacterium]|nr:hypothetical protein [Phycisphaerales bacterium]
MTRTLAIMLLAFAGLIRFSPGVVPEHGVCGHDACAPQMAERPCCDTPAPSESYCSTSDGPCRCGVTPVPDPLPIPDAPLPKTDRDAPTAIRGPPVVVEAMVEPEDEPSRCSAVPASLLAGLTHNEIQALLGIWRT